MAITNGYATLANFRARKDISAINSANDAQIEDMIEAASRFIDEYTGHRFYTTAADETRYFTAGDAYTLELDDDLLSVTTLKTDADDDGTYEYTWTTSDYRLMEANAALKGRPYTYIEVKTSGNYVFPLIGNGVQIVGKFGYSSSAPANIADACMAIVMRTYQNRFGQQQDGTATITGAGVVITPADVPSSVIKDLNLYRRRV